MFWWWTVLIVVVMLGALAWWPSGRQGNGVNHGAANTAWVGADTKSPVGGDSWMTLRFAEGRARASRPLLDPVEEQVVCLPADTLALAYRVHLQESDVRVGRIGPSVQQVDDRDEGVAAEDPRTAFCSEVRVAGRLWAGPLSAEAAVGGRDR